MPKIDSHPTVWPKQPHTQAKHDILVRYLGAWFAIFGASPYYTGVNVIDGFAGPGKYEDDEPGSPVLALNTLLDHKDFAKYHDTRFNFIFNELHTERFESLQSVLADAQAQRSAWPANVKVTPSNQNFQQLAQQLLDSLGPGQRLAPTFAFIDPFGYQDVPMSTVRDLVGHPSCELFIYFDFNSVNRFATAGKVDDHFTALFGCDEYKNAPPAGDPTRSQFIHDLYARQLRKECGFAHVASFRMINATGHTGSYLFFCTQNAKAYDKMKEAMWAIAPDGDYRFDDRYSDQPMLFGNDANTGPLQDQLAEHFAGQTVTVETVIDYVLDTPFHSNQVRAKTLAPMQRAGRISSPNQKRKNTFPAGTLITFPAHD
ncbi:MAG: three-Cys-motif partner protein TcmP [Gordonia sp. (in: high G+C Gram-positive bacteria)]|uniref:three-Cys-motif partner protein TcmP n=1 Tax=Gordonia sp. (in: high G+C Gram-positive bacteria) TaxID=84139 RepID=UPI003C78275F